MTRRTEKSVPPLERSVPVLLSDHDHTGVPASGTVAPGLWIAKSPHSGANGRV